MPLQHLSKIGIINIMFITIITLKFLGMKLLLVIPEENNLTVLLLCIKMRIENEPFEFH